jgi:hypothetical protein
MLSAVFWNKQENDNKKGVYMGQVLSTFKDYENAVTTSLNADKLLNKNTSESDTLNFDTPDIEWNKVNDSLKDKINQEYNKSTFYDTTFSAIGGLFMLIGMGVCLYAGANEEIKETLPLWGYAICFVFMFLPCVVCAILAAYDVFVRAPKLKKMLINGDYFVADLDFVCAYKYASVSAGRVNNSYAYVGILYNIGLHSFEDKNFSYLYKTKDNIDDCETKLDYTQYKLLRFKYEIPFHKTKNYYVICGLKDSTEE